MAVGDAHVFPGFVTPFFSKHIFSFQSHRLLFSHAPAEGKGENTSDRRFASTGDRTHNHQVMSSTRSPLSNPNGSGFGILTQGIFQYFKTLFFLQGSRHNRRNSSGSRLHLTCHLHVPLCACVVCMVRQRR